ncbi:hypothetical protein H0H81_001528 [Sphagnurus paluster]|uniref:Uncharacterized protein n=1 Tax=Sphagnurus paluster TaxID=117069 RepID=A0A9P7GJY7_9AGAR|nr:hypothetical protein H0H81_001528 [Sphagnurus paluster]
MTDTSRSADIEYLARNAATTGAAGSGGLAYVWYSSCHEDLLRSKRLKAAYNTDRVRANDHATIGAILFGVLIPGIFWKRSNVGNLVLGGAGLGSNIGLLTHYTRSLPGDPPPKHKAINSAPE